MTGFSLLLFFCLFVFKLLYEHTNPIPGEERWPVIGQFSSIGSMGLDKSKWLAGEFQRTLTTLGKSSLRPDPPMHLVCPTTTKIMLFAAWSDLKELSAGVVTEFIKTGNFFTQVFRLFLLIHLKTLALSNQSSSCPLCIYSGFCCFTLTSLY